MENTKYAEHLKGCAQLTNEIANILGIRDDSAKQACFATLIIGADRHGLYMDPVHQIGPSNGSSTVKPPQEAKAHAVKQSPPTTTAVGSKRERADLPEANKGALVNPTPEQAEEVKKQELLKAVSAACKLLNSNGHTPPVTSGYLDKEIIGPLVGKPALKELDTDELESLLKFLSVRLDEVKAKAAKESAEEIPF